MTEVSAARLRHHLAQLGHHHDAAHAAAHEAARRHRRAPLPPATEPAQLTSGTAAPRG